ncbi:hypothetical protein [Methylorubrum extorquens]|uniref:hypothetical protein n=1 Tax=Methylorubrum extorquens TaxID=408 RepID=UPI000158FA86|nr:hypothetical protein [Methylorubrum extorquens]ABY32158.1 hypothetical protein Mext_3784 [Methylorubrum extorquens PA1]WIU38762.1 hypothetical protein KQ926_19550 [Methylorubrum extorquens]
MNIVIWLFALAITFVCVNQNAATAEPVRAPIPSAILLAGGKLAADTTAWLKKWENLDLEDASKFQFSELSGSTSINLKIDMIDPSTPKGHRSMGSFVTRNSSANPDVEAAAFNLAVILGYDEIYRPTVKYTLGPRAKSEFKTLLLSAQFTSKSRIANKERILAAIDSSRNLRGVIKAKKDKSATSLDSMVQRHADSKSGPNIDHPIIRFLQADNSQPKSDGKIELKKRYVGNELQLAREYAVIMLIDSVTQQWDRYSGGNIVIRRDDAGVTHFYATDNGGADLSRKWTNRNIDMFSRYDRKAVKKLMALRDFLDDPQRGFIGYTNAHHFIKDLGLDTLRDPATYLKLLRRNVALTLERVEQNRLRFGESAFLADQ